MEATGMDGGDLGRERGGAGGVRRAATRLDRLAHRSQTGQNSYFGYIPRMTEMTALDAKNRFGRLIELAQRAPVTITKNGRPSVVVMSADAYERRRKSAARLLGLAMDRMAAEAKANGLDEATLEKLLADD